jgi:Fe-S-cluster containining protein
VSVVYVPLEHPRFVKAQRDIFVKPVTPDCLRHRCRIAREHGRPMLDACCRYGVDVDVGERDAILARAADIASVMEPGAAASAWFEGDECVDPDFPSGRYVRTATRGQGCIFLAHDQRGCAIHRASLERGWAMDGVKPHVCRLFPLSYESDAIVLSDDYADYSCAYEPDAPSVFRAARAAVEAVFGLELVTALEAAEATVLNSRLRSSLIA